MKQALTFRLSDSRWTLKLSDSVLTVLRANAQSGRRTPEAVGQLFVRDLTKAEVVVELATVLKPTFVKRTRVKFDVAAPHSERDRLFEEGLHCIGIWHSHLEPIPSPSKDDHELARDHAQAAQGQLNCMTFLIVGTNPPPTGLGIWVPDGQNMYQMALRGPLPGETKVQ